MRMKFGYRKIIANYPSFSHFNMNQIKLPGWNESENWGLEALGRVGKGVEYWRGYPLKSSANVIKDLLFCQWDYERSQEMERATK